MKTTWKNIKETASLVAVLVGALFMTAAILGFLGFTLIGFIWFVGGFA